MATPLYVLKTIPSFVFSLYADTCSFHSISGAVESLLRFLFADMVPQQEFKWTIIVENFKHKYKIITDKDLWSEDASDRGNKRFENALTAFENLGVMAKNESGSEVRSFSFFTIDG